MLMRGYGDLTIRARGREALERALKGTTTVGLVAVDGVVISSDKRASSYTFVASKTARKTIKIDEHSVVTISGLVADGQFLVNNLRAFSNIYRIEHGREMPLLAKAKYLSLLMRSYWPVLLIAHMIVGGIDEGGPGLFNVDFLGMVTRERYLATGSGSPVAISVLEGGYREDITVEEGLSLVVDAMKSALSRDTATGDGIDVAIITSEGVKFLSRDEIDSLLKRV